jgi:hypothetical protein
MKKTLLSAILSGVLLAACGGGSAEVACENAYWDGTVGTCLPAGWQVLNREVLDQRGAPAEVIVAFQADKPVSGQFPTVTITRELLKEAMDPVQYSDASVQSVTTLPGYEEGDTEAVTLDGHDLQLHTFSAQPRSDEPRVRFFQVSLSSGSTGFTYTGAVPLTVPEDTEEQIKLILRNATLQDPNARGEEE